MSDLALEDRQAIAELVYRYAWASDSRDFPALRRLFASDGEIVLRDLRRDQEQVIKGAETIASFVEQRHAAEFARGDRRRHFTSNFFVESFDGTVAVARSYFCVFSAVQGQTRQPASTGHYEDRVRKFPDGWKFVQRLITIEAGWTGSG